MPIFLASSAFLSCVLLRDKISRWKAAMLRAKLKDMDIFFY
jgi:hypothetical protein